MGNERYFYLRDKVNAKKAAKKQDDILKKEKKGRQKREAGIVELERHLGTGLNQDWDPSQIDEPVPSYWGKAYYSPTGQIVDRMVSNARELQEGPGAPEYDERFGALTEGPLAEVDAGVLNTERALAASYRSGAAQVRDIGSARGAGRNPVAEQQGLQRFNELIGTERAKTYTSAAATSATIVGQAHGFLQQYADTFAVQSVAFAREWALGAPGLRDEYSNALQRIATERAAVFQRMGEQLIGISQRQQQAEFAASQQEDEGTNWVGLALTAVATIATIYAGGIGGAIAAGAQAGTTAAAFGGVASTAGNFAIAGGIAAGATSAARYTGGSGY